MCRPENPVLGCPFVHVDCPFGDADFPFGLPVPLGEVTGQFVTKEENECVKRQLILKKKVVRNSKMSYPYEKSMS